MNPAQARALAESFWAAYGWDPEWAQPSIQDLADHFTTAQTKEISA